MLVTPDRQPNLFTYLEAPLSVRHRPTMVERLLTNLAQKGRRFIVIENSRRKEYQPKADFFNQMPFPFYSSMALPSPSRPVVVRFPPRNQKAYLDYGVCEYFSNVPGAAEPTRKLEKNRILVLGLLVQMSEEMVRSVTEIDDETLERMKAVLDRIGFGFDMRVPWWNRGYSALYQCRQPPSLI